MKINIWKVFGILLIIFIDGVKAQKTVEQYKIDSLIYIHKSIEFKKDTINFLEIAKPSVHQEKKDLIFFLQGSDPSPLISEDDNGKFLLLPFDLKELSDNTVFVIISKPKIPVYQHFKDLDDHFKIDDQKILTEYMKRNTLEYLADEVNVLVRKYSRHNRIKNIYVIGHSQGGRIASHIKKNRVKKMAVLSVNLLGRYEESINKLRYEEISKQDSLVNNKIEKEYKSFGILKGRKTFNNTFEDLSLKSYKTFTFPSTFNQILKTEIPVLVVYGTNDIGVCLTNDIVRLPLMEKNKKNIHFKTYPLLNHNFEKRNPGTNENETHWQRVLKETIIWLKKD